MFDNVVKYGAKIISKSDGVLDAGADFPEKLLKLIGNAADARVMKSIVNDNISIAEKFTKLSKIFDEITKTMDPTLKMTAKELAEAKKLLKIALDEGVDNIDDVADFASKVAKMSKGEKVELLTKVDEVADNSKDSLGTQSFKWIKANKITVAVGLGVAGLATTALVMYELKNAKKFNIIAIEDVSKGSIIKTMFTIDTDHKFSNKAGCRIDGTNCVPIITPGRYKIDSVKEGNKIIIITKEKVTTNGTQGTFTYFTTFQIELAGAVHDIVEETVATAAAVVTGVGGGVLDGLGLGISEGTLNIIFFVIIGVVAVSFGAIIFKHMKSKKEGSESSDS
jgi:hypothetical protein